MGFAGVVAALVAFLGQVQGLWLVVEHRVHSAPTILQDTREISAIEDPDGGGDGFQVAARSTAGLDTKLGASKDCDSLMAAAKQAGAVDVNYVKEELTLEGGPRHNVRIEDLRAKVLRREPALSGASIGCQSAGAEDTIGVLFDLDDPRPVAQKIVENHVGPVHEYGQFATSGPYFDGLRTVDLKTGESQAFEIVGVSAAAYVEWEIEATVYSHGKLRTVTIDDHGEPFRVTGSAAEGRYNRYYEYIWGNRPHMYVGTRPRV